MTRWYPDTCGCIVDYDDAIKVTAVVKKCAKHTNTLNDDHHLETVLVHNRKKNSVHNAVVDHLRQSGKNTDGIATLYDDADDLHLFGVSAEDHSAISSKVSPLLGASSLRFKR